MPALGIQPRAGTILKKIMKLKAFLLLLLFATNLIHAEEKGDTAQYDIYLLIGQSNCAGRGFLLLEDTAQVLQGVWLLNDQCLPEPAKAPLNRYSNIRKDMSMQLFGPGVSFGLEMHQRTGRPILLVQNARGGSALESWQVGGDGKVSYLDSTLVRAIPALRYGRLRGILWHQGETDISKGTAGQLYVERFTAMVAELRRQLGVGEEIPVIVGEVPQWGWERMEQIERFNTATLEELTRQVPNCHKVSSDGLLMRMPDRVGDPHFSRDAYIELGHRYAVAMSVWLHTFDEISESLKQTKAKVNKNIN